jgi:hypothetical protein
MNITTKLAQWFQRVLKTENDLFDTLVDNFDSHK